MVSNEMSLSNMVMRFFEDVEKERWPDGDNGSVDEDDEGSSGGGGGGGGKAFWESQHLALQEALGKASSAENRIQADTGEAIKKMQSATTVCSCANRAAKDCRSCTLRYIAERLRDAGYNSALCRSKWTRSPDIPPGEHSYVDVVVQTRSGKTARVVIELNFRAEFEMARTGPEYNRLVNSLPEVFVGRSEKLKNAIKIMCSAAKQCMKDNNMHLGPWRKHKYMQSKWLSTPERVAPVFSIPAAVPEKQPKFRASMLTFDFNQTAVEVI